jgi:hypothetical protein
MWELPLLLPFPLNSELALALLSAPELEEEEREALPPAAAASWQQCRFVKDGLHWQ